MPLSVAQSGSNAMPPRGVGDGRAIVGNSRPSACTQHHNLAHIVANIEKPYLCAVARQHVRAHAWGPIRLRYSYTKMRASVVGGFVPHHASFADARVVDLCRLILGECL